MRGKSGAKWGWRQKKSERKCGERVDGGGGEWVKGEIDLKAGRCDLRECEILFWVGCFWDCFGVGRGWCGVGNRWGMRRTEA